MGKGGRIDSWNDVVLDKSAGIARGARCTAQGVFEWRKRTDSARNFDEHTPEDSWKVQKRRPAPAESEKPTGHDKDDERQVEDKNEIGEGAIDHAAHLRVRLAT